MHFNTSCFRNVDVQYSEKWSQKKPFPFSFLSNTVFNYLFSWLSLCFSVSYFPFTSHSTQHLLSSHLWGNMLFTTLQNWTITVFSFSPEELRLKSHSGLEQLNSHQKDRFLFPSLMQCGRRVHYWDCLCMMQTGCFCLFFFLFLGHWLLSGSFL